jgi:hypothetical protein
MRGGALNVGLMKTSMYIQVYETFKKKLGNSFKHLLQLNITTTESDFHYCHTDPN